LPEDLLENREDWPIVKLTEKREAFLNEVIEDSLISLEKRTANGRVLSEELAKAVYLEKIRISQSPWKVDPKDDSKYWSKIKSRLLETADDKSNSTENQKDQLILQTDIVSRYAREIAGKFSLDTYDLSIGVVPFLFSRLLNTASQGWFKGLFSNKTQLESAVELSGNLDQIRNLAKKGTVVLVPTHFSNLDSILIGYGIYLAGLPPFLYGAGLNLYNNNIVGYFINRLGAYKVDRRKKNLFYLETLKSYSRVSMMWGCHSLFFPGGTRGRSGALETQLKYGLLGTVLDAQFQHAQNNTGKKLYILPLVLGYNFVLEASSLINDHLKRTGREKYYIDNDQFSSWYTVLNFVWNLFSKKSKINLSYGKPMDVFGNYVDFDGNSLDASGNPIDISKYFYTEGKLQRNKQRDFEYTKLLADRILNEYRKENTVLASHLVSFVFFNCLKKKFKSLDLYGLLRLPEDERIVSRDYFMKNLKLIKDELVNMAHNDEVKLSDELDRDLDEIFDIGIKNLGIYHAKKVVYQNKEGHITTGGMNLLYYYHNRTTGYNLEKFIV
jgi:glycerol-3-phosphate O-acyltransferase